MRRQIGAAGFGLRILGGFVLGIQGSALASARVKAILPEGILPRVGFRPRQQCCAPVDEGVRLFGRGFPACLHDRFQRGGAGLRLG